MCVFACVWWSRTHVRHTCVAACVCVVVRGNLPPSFNCPPPLPPLRGGCDQRLPPALARMKVTNLPCWRGGCSAETPQSEPERARVSQSARERGLREPREQSLAPEGGVWFARRGDGDGSARMGRGGGSESRIRHVRRVEGMGNAAGFGFTEFALARPPLAIVIVRIVGG